MAISTADGKVYESKMDFLVEHMPQEDAMDLKGTNSESRATELPIIPYGEVNQKSNEYVKDRLDNPSPTDNPMDFLGGTYAMADDEVRGGNIIRPQFGAPGGGTSVPKETRDTHSTPFSKLSPDQQEHFRKNLTDPDMRRMLGIPEGEGGVVPFKK